jgi:hypothetical protein
VKLNINTRNGISHTDVANRESDVSKEILRTKENFLSVVHNLNSLRTKEDFLSVVHNLDSLRTAPLTWNSDKELDSISMAMKRQLCLCH